MKLYSCLRRLFLVGLFLVLNQAAQAYTVGDYYQAGLQLFNAKDYAKAVQYFSAALSLDPNNTASLQGRANSYYSLGQYQNALNDYQKVQALAPSPQLSQFIQAVQAKVGPVSPAVGGTALPAAALGESFNQGVALYQQRQYAAAIPDFQKAIQENPADANASYYLGASYLGLGDMKNAALNLALSNRKQPNPSVEAYVNQLKARMTPEDQQWVDGQLTASASAGNAAVSGPKANKSIGIRLEPGITLLSLNDLTSNAETNQALAAFLQKSDPTYNFNGAVPTGSLNIRVEGVLRLSPNLEIGLPIGMMPVGTASDNISDSGGDTVNDSFKISAFTAGVNVRYLLGAGDFQPFIAGGILVAPINIDYTSNIGNPAGTYYQASGNFTSMGLGGQAQLGLDWHLGDTFVVSPFVGYQVASAGNFTASIQGASGGTAQLSVVPTADGKIITPVADGKLILPVVESTGVLAAGSDAPAGTAPLTVDLGGLTAGIQISIFF